MYRFEDVIRGFAVFDAFFQLNDIRVAAVLIEFFLDDFKLFTQKELPLGLAHGFMDFALDPECCCDECDYYLLCFPEADPKNKEKNTTNIPAQTDH